MRPGTAALALFACFPVLALADVTYTVGYRAEDTKLQITIEAPAQGDGTSFQIPNWAPGSYRLATYRDNVADVTAAAPDGRALTVTRTDDNTWTVDSQGVRRVVFKYTVPGRAQNDILHYSGPGTYMYLVGKKDELCRLVLDLPSGWDSACGLEETGDHRYVSPDYDVLADNPVTFGKFERDTYTVQGILHEIVYRAGDVSTIDRNAVIDHCRRITLAQSDFWGGLPFDKYVWHFTVMPGEDGGSGLEHLTSTQINMAAGLGPGTVGVLSHEYFHVWNVKRIRSKVLGPFDYLELPKTGALWWLEGVTDYYAHLLLFRYGHYGQDHLWSRIVSNVRTTRANDQRLEVSPYDSSYRVGEAANGRGNSAGFGVNYYNTGWVLGMLLDIEIRHRTSGEKSLDDVCRELWEICRADKPGFDETKLRELLVKYGGPELGTCYDEWVMKPGELPVEAQLAKVGLELAENRTARPDFGVNLIAQPTGVTAVRPSWNDKLQLNDRIVAINGKQLSGETRAEVQASLRTALEGIKAGDQVTFMVRRGETDSEVTFTVREAFDVSTVVREKANAAPHEVSLRNNWYDITPLPKDE